MNMIQTDKDKGLDIFYKFEQAKGISYCLVALCKSLDYEALNGVKITINDTQEHLNLCTDVMRHLGEEIGQLSFISFFRTYKEIFKISNMIYDFTQNVSINDINKSEMRKHISNTIFALLNILESMTELLEDMLENPPVQNAA